jgi:predicted metal-dependent peptidase
LRIEVGDVVLMRVDLGACGESYGTDEYWAMNAVWENIQARRSSHSLAATAGGVRSNNPKLATNIFPNIVKALLSDFKRERMHLMYQRVNNDVPK